MKKFVFPGVVLLMALTAVSANAATVQWPVNGHYYERVDVQIDWAGAKAAAESMSYLGVQGHLVTINSAAENLFITNDPAVGDHLNGNDVIHLHWIGGYQLPGSTEPDGGWTWVTGEPFSYNNWWPGEPSNSPDTEDSVIFDHDFTGAGKAWNDYTGGWPGNGYVVEYPVPVPAAFWFLGSGLIGLLGLKRRRKG